MLRAMRVHGWRFFQLVAMLAAISITGQVDSPLYRIDPTPLSIQTQEGTQIYMQTVVVTDREDMSRGLMHVRYLPVNQSMLFFYGGIVQVSFWMKDTYVSLDLLFISVEGTIVDIAHDTTPLSTDQIKSDEDVIAVLEINAGLCGRLGIEVGDKVSHAVLQGLTTRR